MAKRILIYTNHFYPEQFKINEIVDWISDNGHQVRVVTGIPNYPSGKFFKGYGFGSFINSKYSKNVIVNRLPLIPRGSGNFFLLSINYISYFFSTLFFTIYLIIFVKKYDKIFVHHTSPFLIAFHPIIYGIFFKSEKILWDLDLWPDTLKVIGVIKSKQLFTIVEALIKFIYSFYDKILIGSKGFEEILKKRYSKEIIYFPNWADKIIENNYQSRKLNLSLPDDHIKIMYTGNIGIAQSFDKLAKSIKKLKKYKIFWIFVGDGSYKNQFKKELKNTISNHQYLFINQIKINEIPSYAKYADFMLISLKSNYLFEKTVPAKLQTYLALSKPVIGLIEGEAAEIIFDSKSGFVDDSHNHNRLEFIIQNILKMNKSQIEQFGINGRKYYDLKFNSKLRKKDLLKLFND